MTAVETKVGEDGLRHVPIAWEALEDAFENNAPEVHSYLNLDSGEVIRVVDGIAEPTMHARISTDPNYLRVDPVSSREQYRWMERYISTIEDSEFRQRLVSAIDGKGAFRRFKDVLMNFPVERERWFTFRSERLRIAMDSWLDAHGIKAAERKSWEVPTAADVKVAVEVEEKARPARPSRAAIAEALRAKLHEQLDLLPIRELDMASEFLVFLLERRPIPRGSAKTVERNDDEHDDDDDDAEAGA
jgi:hypothetical protein